jgi:hypothetical protein
LPDDVPPDDAALPRPLVEAANPVEVEAALRAITRARESDLATAVFMASILMR